MTAWDTAQNRYVRLRNSLGRTIFGDRLGFALFLATVCVVALFWRTEVFINDNDTLVATLDALADGRLWIERVEGDTVFDAPGAEIRDGKVYGRNYGQLVVSLPALVFVRAVDFVADLRVGLIASLHLLALALFVQLGSLLDRRRLLSFGGSAVVFGSILLNVAVVTPMASPSHAHLALQVTAIVATGFVAVVLYRLVAFEHTRRLGVLAGLGGVFALPIGFWATIPKRHVFSVLVCVAILYLFARSRGPDATTRVRWLGSVPLFRAGAYAFVGFLTWIHAAEGLFVFLALVAVDLPTAPRNDRRTLGFLVGVFALSLTPAVITNYFVTGNLARPPRTLGAGGFHAPVDPQPVADAVAAGGPNVSVLGTLGWLVSTVWEIIVDSLAVFRDPERVSQVFLRSSPGDLTDGRLAFAGTNLSVLEAAPVLGAGIGAVIASTLRFRHARPDWPRPTPLLAGTLLCSFVLLYLSRLPLHAMVTQRYLLPVYPLALYLCFTSATVRRVCAHTGPLLWSYTAVLFLGGQLFVTYVLLADFVIAEATQLHARLALLSCLLCVALVAATSVDRRLERPAAAGVGLAGAVGTLFLVVGGLYYFAGIGELLVAVLETVSDRLVFAG